MEFFAVNGHICLGGNQVSLRGVNFFGPEGNGFCLDGLWAQPLTKLIDVLKENNFNFVRITLSIDLMLNMEVPVNYISANPQYTNFTAGKLMDVVVEELAAAGIAVMMNLHQYGADHIAPLWYTQKYPEALVVKAWQNVAKRYINASNLFAVDLKNEPHGTATWGGARSTDWASASERIGNAIHEINPKLLIFVAGITGYDGQPGVWGDCVDGARKRPVVLKVPHKVVYSPHCYRHWNYVKLNGFDNKTYFDNCFGNLARDGKSTVVIGEYGYDETSALDTQWVNELADYVLSLGMTSIAYWAFNFNANLNQNLLEEDWLTVKPDKMQLIAKIIPKPTAFDFASKTT